MPVLSNVRKIISQEIDYNSPLTSNLFTDLAAAMNAMCDFMDVKCTHLTGSGLYQTKSTKSNLIIFGIGAGGGGGGGGNGSIIDDGNASNVTRIRRYGAAGSDGQAGTDSIFGGDIVGIGGKGGKGGFRMPGYNIAVLRAPDEMRIDRDVFVDYEDHFQGVRRQNGNLPSFNGIIRGQGGEGGTGASSVTTPSFDTRDAIRGLDGYFGQDGLLGVRCVESIGSSQIPYSCGTGGIGGEPGIPTEYNGLTVTNSAPPGQTGGEGAMIVYEFGF